MSIDEGAAVGNAPPGSASPWRGRRPWGEGGYRRSGRGSRRQRRYLVFAAIVLAVEVFGAQVAGRHQVDARPLDALGYWLLVIGAMALPLRVRWRMPVFLVVLATTVAYVLLGYPDGPVFLAALISMFGAVRTGHRTGVWISLGIGYLAYVGLSYVVTDIGGIAIRRPSLGSAILIAAWIIVACAVAEGIRVRAAHFAEVARARAEQARARAEQERRQASEERLRIARELHDVLGHHLSLINVQAGVGLHLMDEQPDQARVALEAIKQASAEALGEVRAVLGVLRPKDETAPRAPAPSLANLAALVDPADTVIVGATTAAAAGGRPGRVPDRPGVADQRAPARRPGRHGARSPSTYRPDGLQVRVVDDGAGPTRTARLGGARR